MKKILLLLCICLSIMSFTGCQQAADSDVRESSKAALKSDKELSFDEMIHEIMEDEHSTYEAVCSEIVAHVKQSKTMSELLVIPDLSEGALIQRLKTLTYHRDSEYIRLKNRDDVIGLKFYYSYSGTPDARHMIALHHVSLDSHVLKTQSYFDGNVYVCLERDYRLHYILNGTLYRKGIADTTGSIAVSEGESAEIVMKALQPSYVYDHIYADGNVWTARKAYSYR